MSSNHRNNLKKSEYRNAKSLAQTWFPESAGKKNLKNNMPVIRSRSRKVAPGQAETISKCEFSKI